MATLVWNLAENDINKMYLKVSFTNVPKTYNTKLPQLVLVGYLIL